MPNLATLMVGLGYDLSALEKGAPEAYRMINEQTMGMSAQMKRSAREGAEAFRSIDEMIGIHINRPMTRLLVETFPQFGKALADVLGGVAFGAVAFAGYELFNRVSEGIDHARKAQEEFAAATEKARTVFEDSMASYEKADKMRSLSGLSLSLFKIDSASIDEARKHIDELAAAFADLAKKEEAASGVGTRTINAAAEMWHTLYHSSSDLGAERIAAQLPNIQARFDELSKQDALHGTAESAKFIASNLSAAEVNLRTMSAHQMTGFQTFLRDNLPPPSTGNAPGYSAAEVSAQQKFVSQLEEMNRLQQAGAKDQGGQEAQARSAAALEAQKKAIADLQGDLKAWNDAANQGWQIWMKINAEIEKAVASLGEGALPAGAARNAEFQKVYGSFQVGPPPGAPQLADQTELEKVSNDQSAAWQKAGEVVASIESPMQKFSTQLRILEELESQGRISTEQFAQAQQQLQNQLVNSESHLDRMQRALEELLKKSDSAKAGMQAFMLQLNIDTSRNGQFTFDLLSKSLQGFEDETVKALTGAKTSWRSFFDEIDQMVLKFFLNKLIQQLLSGFGGGSFLSSLFGGGGASSANGFSIAQGAIAGFASGTDYAPGGMAWVGENGPELMNLPRGSSVTPASSVRSNGMVVQIDARGGEIGVEEKIARALTDAGPHFIAQAVANMSEIQRRTPR